MKMTPFLAGINTVVTLLLAAYITVAVGVAGYNNAISNILLPLLLLIFLLNIVTGWFVALKKTSVTSSVNSVWRITQTLTILAFLFLTLGSLGTSIGLF